MKRHFEAKRMKWNMHPDQYNQSLNQANQYNNLVDTCNNYSQSVQVHQSQLVNQSQMYEQIQKPYGESYAGDIYQTGIAASTSVYPQMARSQSDSSSNNSNSPLSSAPVSQYSDYGYAVHDPSWSRYMNFQFPTNQNTVNTFSSHHFANGYQMKLEPTN